MTSIIVNQNYGHNLIKYFKYVKQKKESPGIIARAMHMWCRGTEFYALEAHKLPTRGFSVQIFESLKMMWLQAVDSISIFHRMVGFV